MLLFTALDERWQGRRSRRRAGVRYRAAQRAGLRDYYSEYSIAVGPVEHASTWVREP